MAREHQPDLSISDFEAEVKDLSENGESKNIMVYGGPGCGKTVLMGQAPNAFIFACEPGFISAKRVSKSTAKFRTIPDWRTADAGLRWLENGAYADYEWIGIDTTTSLLQRSLQQFVKDEWDRNPEKRTSAYQPDRPDYMKAQNTLKTFVTRLVDLPVNTIWTAHEWTVEDQNGDEEIVPQIEGSKGSLCNFVTGHMNAIGYMRPVRVGSNPKSTKQVRRIIWQPVVTEDGQRIRAKDHFNALGKFTDDITFPEIIELIGEPDAKPAPTPAKRTRARA